MVSLRVDLKLESTFVRVFLGMPLERTCNGWGAVENYS